ncbi:hypothetical protein [Legionella fallonii]|uniref:Uncharacterized protein n=1 Tax=Legionella fallonii LLAP-10 TaxID=1212491 RepID=A0A098G1D6_9GAMM|nr:hypothetical protein [Legionella fallonii]CEG56298.1 protein of unknown function [Legionella fallonii LLAP-10]
MSEKRASAASISHKKKHSALLEQYTNSPPHEDEMISPSEHSSSIKRSKTTHLESNAPLQQEAVSSTGKEKEATVPQKLPPIFTAHQKELIAQNKTNLIRSISALKEAPLSISTLSRLQARYNLANNTPLTVVPRLTKSLKAPPLRKKPVNINAILIATLNNR